MVGIISWIWAHFTRSAGPDPALAIAVRMKFRQIGIPVQSMPQAYSILSPHAFDYSIYLCSIVIVLVLWGI